MKDKFIEKSKNIYNDKYFYDDIHYINSNTKISILCIKHNIYFQQSPTDHLRGNCKGCISCYNENKLLNYIIKCNKKHNNYYDYSLVEYTGILNKIKILCPIHGLFEQIASVHLKSGCKLCGYDLQKMSKNDFIKISNEKHNNYYDYSLVNYKNAQINIKIICPIHGEFLQKPYHHINGSGCRKCFFDNKIRYSIDEFIEKSNLIHNFKYDYSNSIYKDCTKKIKITCPIHGEFEQNAKNHMDGHGCSKCSNKNVSKIEIEWLDSLNIPLNFRQRTLIIRNKEYRVDAFDDEKNIIYEFYGDFWHGNPEKFNLNLINPILLIKYGVLYNKTIKREDFFKLNGYKVISIWENDYKKEKYIIK